VPHDQMMVCLDSDARQFLAVVAETGAKPSWELTALEARVAVKVGNASLCLPGPAVAELNNILVSGANGFLPARLYRPASAPHLPLLIYFHGGGFVYCDLETHDGLCRRLAMASGCLVASVDYRLAPENPFPAAIEDALAATRDLMRRAVEFGADPRRIAVGGDSAGGNLAAGVAQVMTDLSAQLLMYPLLDFTFSHPSHRENGQKYGLTSRGLEWFRDQYLPSSADWTDPRASPARTRKLGGLPRAYLLTAGYDPLRDEAFEYAERLTHSGVQTFHRHVAGQIHGFAMMDRVMTAAVHEVEDAGKWMNDMMNRKS